MGRGRRWGALDDIRLREEWSAGRHDDHELARLTGRSIRAVGVRRLRLGLTLSEKERAARGVAGKIMAKRTDCGGGGGPGPITVEEAAFIRDVYDPDPEREARLARILERPIVTIRLIAGAL